MTKLATIQKIHSIQPHTNADKLEVGKVKEWPVVIKKGEYKDGDLVVFIVIDSIVPSTNPYFAFLEKQKFRIWNARFRGSPSQGLVCPLSILGPLRAVANGPDESGGHYLVEEGLDVTEELGITKYEKGLDALIAGDAKGGFPTHLITITDEDNLLNYPEVRDEFVGEQCYLTVKADGSSVTVIHNDGQVMICSRRLEQKEGTGFWVLADSYGLPDKLRALKKNIAIQAEGCGGKIQGNPLGLRRPSMFVFNVKDLDTGRWFGYQEIADFCKQLEVPMVQLAHDVFKFDATWTIEKLQGLANAVTYVTSEGDVRKGEGIVLRPTYYKYSPVLGKPLSVKILNQDYKQ